MAVHKLSLDEFDEIDYNLIAIHTPLEDYRLAYFINQQLSIILSKSLDEVHISVKEGETCFSRFYFYDKVKDIDWNLLQNKNEVIGTNKKIKTDLFSNQFETEYTKVYLLPELKKVDYFLKIENNERDLIIEDVLTKLRAINRLSTVYEIDTRTIKSKNNLIF